MHYLFGGLNFITLNGVLKSLRVPFQSCKDLQLRRLRQLSHLRGPQSQFRTRETNRQWPLNALEPSSAYITRQTVHGVTENHIPAAPV